MPTYDYVCDRCGHEFELFQKMTDRPRKRCPRCQGTVRRRIGPGAGLLFRGSGFYVTDYRSSDYKAKAAAEKGGATPPVDPGKPGASKGDSKKATSGSSSDKS